MLGSQGGSPAGSEPSGSRRAARWPWLRWALTSDIAGGHAVEQRLADRARGGGSGTGIAAARPAAGSSRRRHPAPGRGWRARRRRSRRPRQQRVDLAQERAALGALDDAVVVGGGDRHDLVDAQLAQGVGGDRSEARRVADRAGGEDGPLAGHQARDRGDRAEAAGVGQRDGGAAQLVGLDPPPRVRPTRSSNGRGTPSKPAAGRRAPPGRAASGCRPCARRRRPGRG